MLSTAYCGRGSRWRDRVAFFWTTGPPVGWVSRRARCGKGCPTARPRAPCSLPQTRKLAPCWPSVGYAP